MRPDFAKVVTERPRVGGSPYAKGEKRELQNVPLDELPKSEKIRLKWIKQYGGKEFTDVLGPLRGYVHSVIGRPFSEVYSEIKRSMPGNTLAARHILGHLWSYLETKVYIDEHGRPCQADLSHFPRWYGRSHTIEYSKYGTIAYVDPRDDIIKRAPEQKYNPYQRNKGKPRKKVIWVDQNTGYLRVEGIWYEGKFLKTREVEIECGDLSEIFKYHQIWKRTVPRGNFDPITGEYHDYDVVLKRREGEFKSHEFSDTYGRNNVFCYSKRQLNKREIRKLKLREVA